jgi:hypothetical protein
MVVCMVIPDATTTLASTTGNRRCERASAGRRACAHGVRRGAHSRAHHRADALVLGIESHVALQSCAAPQGHVACTPACAMRERFEQDAPRPAGWQENHLRDRRGVSASSDDAYDRGRSSRGGRSEGGGGGDGRFHHAIACQMRTRALAHGVGMHSFV